MAPDFSKLCAYVGMPLHGRQVDVMASHHFWLPGKPGSGLKIIHWPNVNSSLGHCFNGLLCDAYAKQSEHSIDYFAMIHGDVVPDHAWLTTMIEELERVDADFLSAVVAIKDQQGLTSTGLHYKNKPHLPTRRLTMTEVHKTRLPRTFCYKDLVDCGLATGEEGEVFVLNTGLWVARYQKPWWQDNKIVFRQTHEIKKLPRPDGKGDYLQCWFHPEDWRLTEELVEMGARVYATTVVGVEHVGWELYSNRGPWGSSATDEQFVRMCQASGQTGQIPKE